MEDIPFLEHKKAEPNMTRAITEKLKMRVCSTVIRRYAKGLYAGKRSFHFRIMETKIRFFGSNRNNFFFERSPVHSAHDVIKSSK